MRLQELLESEGKEPQIINKQEENDSCECQDSVDDSIDESQLDEATWAEYMQYFGKGKDAPELGTKYQGHKDYEAAMLKQKKEKELAAKIASNQIKPLQRPLSQQAAAPQWRPSGRIREEEEVSEVSQELLGRYKTAAGKSASAADKAGDYEKGNKRFRGIVKATKKELEQDVKKHGKQGVEEAGYKRTHIPTGGEYHGEFNASHDEMFDNPDWYSKKSLDAKSDELLKKWNSQQPNDWKYEKGVTETEGEGESEGLPHLTPKLASHISQQIDSEGPHAVSKSVEWGDGAADELIDKIKSMLDDYASTVEESAAWQKKSGKNKNGGLNQKGVDSYRKEHPGSKLQTAVTTKPSKLKKDSKAAKRRKSFCARMGGMKGPMKDEHGKPTRKALALRKWNCESVEQFEQMLESHFEQMDVLTESVKQRLDPKCWKGKHKEGTKIKNGVRVNNCVTNEGAPELLKAEMPLVRHIEKELAQHGYEKGTPEYNEMFKHSIAMYRKFGNVDAIKKGVAEATGEAKPVNMKRWVRDFERREDNNFHTENVLAMAQLVGTPEDIATMKSLVKQHKGFGLSEKQFEIRQEISNRLRPLVKQKIADSKTQGVAEGSESSDNLVSTLNSFGYYSDNGNVYVNDGSGDKIARQGSNWKHQSGKRGTGAEELGEFLGSKEGVAEGSEQEWNIKVFDTASHSTTTVGGYGDLDTIKKELEQDGWVFVSATKVDEQDVAEAMSDNFRNRERNAGLEDEDRANKAQASKPTMVAVYFYNVPEDMEDEALAIGLKKGSSGRWGLAQYDKSGATFAHKQNIANQTFGQGKRWEPAAKAAPVQAPVAQSSTTAQGYYFYEVPYASEQDAAKMGLKKSKSGKWMLPIYSGSGGNTNKIKVSADRVFGAGRWWAPKK